MSIHPWVLDATAKGGRAAIMKVSLNNCVKVQLSQEAALPSIA
jgi:hypothetical protein